MLTVKFLMPLKSNFTRTSVLLIALAFAFFTNGALAEEQPINFSADAVSSNQETGVMVATGNVVLEQNTMRLTADKVEYDRKNGTAVATGNITFIDGNGGTHSTTRLVLEDNFASAFAESVISQLEDGSWISAVQLTANEEKGSTFEDTRFTPCDCDFKNDGLAAWELQTSKTSHDPASKTVYHHNVTMHIYSVPIMYFPYLSHPDWTVRRRSGLLPPRISFSSDFGTTYAQSYFWVTGETHDVEITPYVLGNKGNAVRSIFRQRWDQSTLDAKIYGGRVNTYKNNREDVAGIDANFDTMLADNWITNVKVQRASQDTFMRRYNLNAADELKLSVLTERIDPMRYTRIEAYDTQDLTSDRDPNAEPTVLPSVFHERYLETSRDDLSVRLSLSAIQLDNDDHTDMKRWSSELYARHDVPSDYGNFSLEGRLSGQYRDIETATGDVGYTGELGQATVAGGVGWSQPISLNFAQRSAVLEPKVKFVSVKSTDRTAKVPNRDSSDFRLDEANLFLLHREQGEDYNITNARVDGGATLSMWDNYLGDVTGFVGSSVRVSGETPLDLNAASDGDRYSDILASLTVQPTDRYSLSMTGRFHPRDFHLNETRIDASLNLDNTVLSASYNQLSQSYFDSADEEVETLVLTAYQNLGYQWSANVSQTYDMTKDSLKLSDSSVSLNYGGGLQNCLTISMGYSRDTESDRDIRPVDEVFLLFDFKYLGSVSSSGLGK